MEGNLASLVVVILEAGLEAEISRIGWRQMPKAEISLGQCARKQLAFIPDALCNCRRIRSRVERNIRGVAISDGRIWLSENPPGLGQCFGKRAMSLPCSKEVQKIAMLAGRSVLPFAPRALAVRHSGEPDEE